MITTAPANTDAEFEWRRKKYAIMMALRAVCVLLAACFARVSLVIALAFAIAGLVLPWCAVIIANDRAAKRHRARIGSVRHTPERGLPSGDDRVVDG